MFGFSKKKDDGIEVKDIIWISSEAKWKYLVKLWEENKETVFIFWFDETLRQAEESISQKTNGPVTLILAREIHARDIENKPVIFAEHFPLLKKEEGLFRDLHCKEIKILSALDEPLFKRFGSDKIIELVKRLGMNENEPIEHAMITQAVQNAQQKIEKKLIV